MPPFSHRYAAMIDFDPVAMDLARKSIDKTQPFDLADVLELARDTQTGLY